jgi:hypothetical protein
VCGGELGGGDTDLRGGGEAGIQLQGSRLGELGQ